MIKRLLICAVIMTGIGLVGHLQNRDIETDAQANKTSPETSQAQIARNLKASMKQQDKDIRAYKKLILNETETASK